MDHHSCPSGEIGRRTGLKILGSKIRAGSSPASGTKRLKLPPNIVPIVGPIFGGKYKEAYDFFFLYLFYFIFFSNV